MEGIIPLVLRTIKRNRNRRQYRCLSSEAALTFDVSDFHVNDDHLQRNFDATPPRKTSGFVLQDEREYEGKDAGYWSPQISGKPKTQVVRFRSRSMSMSVFSCLTGPLKE
ncbi:hypothetical protein Nepgr_010597 [Nepenthes gracilis]|uniref:Uncharacterized protein n=1 Tax=Nepenthes gracilis TaxID=150966 RepID=A0AAD3XL81_NEPGR|nr:hypothetical protein Nepgr_010597 [Nepenthes gracilis]